MFPIENGQSGRQAFWQTGVMSNSKHNNTNYMIYYIKSSKNIIYSTNLLSALSICHEQYICITNVRKLLPW